MHVHVFLSTLLATRVLMYGCFISFPGRPGQQVCVHPVLSRRPTENQSEEDL